MIIKTDITTLKISIKGIYRNLRIGFCMLYLTNTVTGKKEKFIPHTAPFVYMYACGITPYDYSHIGHGRSAVSFDLLFRVLSYAGYTVSYARNFTDVDDKLLKKAHEQYGDPLRYGEIAATYIADFRQCMEQLNCLTPTHEPLVTENIPGIIDFISKLIDKGYAYVADGDVYFRVHRFTEYGKLSHRTIEQLMTGVRVAVEPNKEDPLDFALWKREADDTFWKSPWGYGRPGWHIECSVLAATYVHEELDIHGGGLDIMFPHHENEIAQSEALHGRPLAHYWVHNGMVQVNHEKMSKSLGNIIVLSELLKQIDPLLVRFYLLNHHYRSPLDFSYEYLKNIQKSYQKLQKALAQTDKTGVTLAELMECSSSVVTQMAHYLYDDLNSAGMFGYLFETIDEWAGDHKSCSFIRAFLYHVCGLPMDPVVAPEVHITPEIAQLIADRDEARANKQWARADELRIKLASLGYVVRDKKV